VGAQPRVCAQVALKMDEIGVEGALEAAEEVLGFAKDKGARPRTAQALARHHGRHRCVHAWRSLPASRRPPQERPLSPAMAACVLQGMHALCCLHVGAHRPRPPRVLRGAWRGSPTAPQQGCSATP